MEAAEAAPVPTLFAATTLKVYAVPLVKPDTVIGELAPVAVKPPGFEVTVNPVMATPPVDAGAAKATEADASPAVAEPITGAPGNTALTVKLLVTWGAGK